MTSRNGNAEGSARQRFGNLEGLVTVALAAALILGVPFAASGGDQKKDQKKEKNFPSAKTNTSKALQGLPITELNEPEAILHALDRLGYGPRPGDVERVREMERFR